MTKRFLTLDAVLRCTHIGGKVDIHASQSWVTIEGRPVLVATDPETRTVQGCPVGPPNKLCTVTLAVTEGYSTFIRIDGDDVCLDTVTGSTDGTLFPAEYRVIDPGQPFVGGGE